MDSPQQTESPESLAARFLALVGGNWITQALSVAARLHLADRLEGGPRTSHDLAQEAGVHAPSLHRLMRALVTLDIVQEQDDGAFALLPMGALLKRQSDTSLYAWTVRAGEEQWQTWGNLLYSIQTGQSARTLLLGTEGFEHLERDPEKAALFNQSMVELTRLISGAVVHTYDFSDIKTIVDVGGGYGELLAALLAANPHAQGVLFDMPHAVEEGRRHMERAGLSARCRHEAGSFFEAVPGGADIYVLKSIVHDWNDGRSSLILDNCRRAMPTGAKLLIVERVLPDRLTASAADRSAVRSDLNMLVALAARERTEAEFRALLETAHLSMTRIVPARGGFSIIEAIAQEPV